MTQYQKILELHASGDWICGNAYRAKFIFSAHKRRQEMIDRKLCQGFDWRPCEHGFREVRDYKLNPMQNLPNPMQNYRPEVLVERRVRETQKSLL
jgi:hypothetical protein